MTTIRRPGSGRPIDSHVLRPMMIVCPIVSCLNRCRSADRRHGNCPPRPMTPFSAMAAMRETRITGTYTATGAEMCGCGL